LSCSFTATIVTGWSAGRSRRPTSIITATRGGGLSACTSVWPPSILGPVAIRTRVVVVFGLPRVLIAAGFRTWSDGSKSNPLPLFVDI
jgi:hypothetical protein